MSATFGKCKLCPSGSPDKRLFGGGVCGYHLNNPKDDQSKEKLPKEVVKELLNEKLLRQWYEEQFQQRTEFCENCRKVRLTDPQELWRQKAMVAHILPKKLFPSVATHPLNRWFGDLQCHTDFDRGWGHAMQMPVWDLCVERYTQFMTLISVGEHRHLPEPLRQLLDKSLL